MRTLSLSLLPSAAILLMPRAALGFDDEPNDSIAEAETIGPGVIERGALDDSTDTTDVFEWTARGPGTLLVQLADHVSSFHEFSLEVQEADETVVATGSVEVVTLDAELTVEEGETLYIVLEAVEGDASYELSVTFDADPPVLTSISDSDPDPTDTITLSGSGFGTTCNDLLVYVGQAQAEVTSCSDTSLDVVVSVNAYDGDAWVVRHGEHSAHIPLTIAGGTSSPAHASWLTPPDSSELTTLPGGSRIYFDRILVGFYGDLDETAVAAEIDDAVDAVNLAAGSTVLLGWDEVGFAPAVNLYQVELDWDGSAGASDWWELFDALDANVDVTAVSPVSPLIGTTPLFGPGQDVATSWTGVQDSYGAYDLAAIEEAWRLFASTSATGLVPNEPSVLIVDSGLVQVDFTEDKTTYHEFLDGTNGNLSLWRTTATKGACDPETYSLYTSDSQWRDNYRTSTRESHGTMVAGLVAASNNGLPRWDGSDGGVSSQRLAGVLGGLQQWGINDNAHTKDSSTDEQGEMIAHHTAVLNGYDCGDDDAGSDTVLHAVPLVLRSIAQADAGANIPDIIIAPFINGMKGSTGLETIRVAWSYAADPMAATPLWVVSAGNAAASTDSFDTAGSLAFVLEGTPSAQVLVATGSHSSATLADQRAMWPPVSPGQFSPLPPSSSPPKYIAAPAQSWTVLKDSDSTTYTSSWGTTLSTALVGGIAAMIKAADEHDDLVGGSALRAHILQNASDITGVWDSSTAMSRVDATAALARLLAKNGHLDRAIRVVVADNRDSNPRVCSQEYDPVSFEFVADTDACYVTTSDACDPVAVAVDPRGDLIYALCDNSPAKVLVLAPVTTSGLPEDTELRKVGLITLTDKTTSVYAGLAVTAEGYLVVPVINSSGDSEFVAIDTFDGSLLSSGTALHGSGVTRTGSMAITRDQTTVAVTGTDADTDTADEEIATIDMRAYHRAGGPGPHGVGSLALDSLTDPGANLRALDWHAGDGVFVGGWRSETSTSDLAIIGPRLSPPPAWEVRLEADLGSSQAIYDLAVNPTDGDELAYVANFELGDITPEGPWFMLSDILGTGSPQAYIEYDLGGTTTWARMVEFSDSGRWLVLGFQGISSITSFHAIPHDSALSSTTSSPTDVVDITGWDAMAVSTDKPRGVAITPSMSVLSPRPGKELSGVRKLVVLVRDPTIDRLSFDIDGSTTVCADDTQLTSGLSTSCTFDASGWSGTADRIIQITGHYGEDTPSDSSDDGSMVLEARY